jgi:hypothetical protein
MARIAPGWPHKGFSFAADGRRNRNDLFAFLIQQVLQVCTKGTKGFGQGGFGIFKYRQVLFLIIVPYRSQDGDRGQLFNILAVDDPVIEILNQDQQRMGSRAPTISAFI